MRRAYLSADFPGGFAAVEEDATRMQARVKQWSETYDKSMAQELINAAANYPWVPPQLTATLVLSGNSALMNKVAEHAAARMMESGVDWGERSRLNRYYRRESTRNAVEWKEWLDQ